MSTVGKTLKKNFYTTGHQEFKEEAPEIQAMPSALDPIQDYTFEAPEKSYQQSEYTEPEQEVVDQVEEVEDPLEEIEEPVQEAPKTSSPKISKPMSTKDNIRALREAKEKAEREAEFMRKEMESFRRELLQMNQQPRQQIVEEEPEEDIPFPTSEDELVEAKHLKKIIKNQARLEEQLRAQQQANEAALITQRIKSQYPDFEKVVSTENVQKLNTLFPEVAESLKLNPNLYSKAVSAYSIMKQYGIHKDDIYAPQKQQAASNTAKPRTATSLKGEQSHSPLANANAFAQGLTPDLKRQLWLEMEEARKNR